MLENNVFGMKYLHKKYHLYFLWLQCIQCTLKTGKKKSIRTHSRIYFLPKIWPVGQWHFPSAVKPPGQEIQFQPSSVTPF